MDNLPLLLAYDLMKRLCQKGLDEPARALLTRYTDLRKRQLVDNYVIGSAGILALLIEFLPDPDYWTRVHPRRYEFMYTSLKVNNNTRASL